MAVGLAIGWGVAFLNGFGAGLGGAFSTGLGAGSGIPEGGMITEDITGTAFGSTVGLGAGGLEDGKGIDRKEVADGSDDDDDEEEEEAGIFMKICCAWCLTAR